jgi:phosphoketolase
MQSHHGFRGRAEAMRAESMRISQTVLPIIGIALGTFSTAAHSQAAQPASAAPASQQAPAAETAPAPTPVPPAVTASSLLQPALTQAQSTLSAMKTDKWKKGSVRDEAGQNIAALLHDLQSNIPPLMTAADAEPTALSRAIPLMKHLDAFYDVLLRVEEASRVSAPAEQVSALQQTMLDVNKARNAYDDQMQANAVTHEKQVFDLQTQLRAQQDAAAQAKQTAAAAPPPCKPAAPARKKKRTTTSTTPSAGTPAPSQPQ